MLPKIMAPYSKFLDDNDIKHPFIRNWMAGPHLTLVPHLSAAQLEHH